MPRIHGTYEYDDDDLTPGNKKEGGLHQNLFDSEGNLKGSARFIPDDGSDDPEPVVIYEPAYVDDEEYERRRAREQDETAELIAKVVALLVVVATPHAKRLWREKAHPALQARKAKKAARQALKAAKQQPVVVEATVVDSSLELAEASKEYRTDMTSAEAQARYLAALAARAFSDEQMRLIANANMVDGEGLAELRSVLAELPPQQVANIITALEADPSLLGGDVVAELGKILRRGRDDEDLVPIEKRTDE